MKHGLWIGGLLLAVLAGNMAVWGDAPASVPAPTSAPSTDLLSYLKDNLTIKADVAEADLTRIDQKPFRVYVYNSFDVALTGVSLAIASDQYTAKVQASSDWKDCPTLESAAKGGLPQYFTVTLTRKSQAAGPCDVFLKLSIMEHEKSRLAAFMPLSEAIDQQVVPFNSAITIDGKTSPGKWSHSLALTHFLVFPAKKKEGEICWQSREPGRTRLQLAADDENLYLFADFMYVGTGNKLKLSVATGLEAKPVTISMERKTGKIATSVPIDGIVCKKCEDDPLMQLDPKDPFKCASAEIYECKIPRKALGIGESGMFFANVVCDGQLAAYGPQQSYWRGNPVSAGNPVTFGRFVIQK